MKRVYSYLEAIALGVSEIGNKTANLLLMANNGIVIPKGIVVPRKVLYPECLDRGKLQQELMESDLGTSNYFCVRSSSLNEDSKSSSYAGQYETYCGVRKQEIADYVGKVVDSLNSKRAGIYKQQVGNRMDGMAVLIQELIECEKSGVLFTKNPLTGLGDQFVLEAGYGLGEPLVSGEITPDNYLVDRSTKKVTNYQGFQDWGKFFLNGTIEKRVLDRRDTFCLNDEEIEEIINTGMNIERLFGCPQDIEWGFYKQKLFIFQSRSITT